MLTRPSKCWIEGFSQIAPWFCTECTVRRRVPILGTYLTFWVPILSVLGKFTRRIANLVFMYTAMRICVFDHCHQLRFGVPDPIWPLVLRLQGLNSFSTQGLICRSHCESSCSCCRSIMASDRKRSGGRAGGEERQVQKLPFHSFFLWNYSTLKCNPSWRWLERAAALNHWWRRASLASAAAWARAMRPTRAMRPATKHWPRSPLNTVTPDRCPLIFFISSKVSISPFWVSFVSPAILYLQHLFSVEVQEDGEGVPGLLGLLIPWGRNCHQPQQASKGGFQYHVGNSSWGEYEY